MTLTPYLRVGGGSGCRSFQVTVASPRLDLLCLLQMFVGGGVSGDVDKLRENSSTEAEQGAD